MSTDGLTRSQFNQNDSDNQNIKYIKRRNRIRGYRVASIISKRFGPWLYLVGGVVFLLAIFPYAYRQRGRGDLRPSWIKGLHNHVAIDHDYIKDTIRRKESRNHVELFDDTFADERRQRDDSEEKGFLLRVLRTRLEELDQDIANNAHGGQRWIRASLLPPLPGGEDTHMKTHRRDMGDRLSKRIFFKAERYGSDMAWRSEWKSLSENSKKRGPRVDYSKREKYRYPDVLSEPPEEGGYPELRTLKDIMKDWHQDEDFEGILTETLIHFNFSNHEERKAAKRFRNAGLPFKVYDIPEIADATAKWTDAYLTENFQDRQRLFQRGPKASGTCQESPNNFFAFFIPKLWNIHLLGLPPTRDNDWNYAMWAEHARYADATELSPDQPHFYWQAGVSAEERYSKSSAWTFITRDLPSFSSTEKNFFLFHPEEQKGIQCRFGERGVVAATHFDGGRNMVAMIHGAKRYILSPPNQCSKLGIFTNKKSPIYRHSLLNFGHIKYLDNESENQMTTEERSWLELASKSLAVETVLKQGEVLYIPSHWFHYIISVQKSAQCNVRSGIDESGTEEFGGRSEVERCID